MRSKKFPTVKYLRQVLREENGHLYWISRPRKHFKTASAWKTWNTKYAGTEAGCLARCRHPTWNICLNYISIKIYLIVWALYYGKRPSAIDHINRDATDDRIDNLRLATPSQNQANRKTPSNNTSGLKGVSFEKERNKWVASIGVNYKRIFLGRFDTSEEAHVCYMEAARKHNGDFACDGKPSPPDPNPRKLS